ncbi:hypothetical protein CDAR_250251 [Caerostris darwini]|uniref:Uncharacterized protein n=1 Tax=Caerostris darwini TaxID=1538125 RepID=A0AAV4QJG6_9ARAC|nr:hypothetical protein CDAR_250251 [Caerostris darwini]
MLSQGTPPSTPPPKICKYLFFPFAAMDSTQNLLLEHPIPSFEEGGGNSLLCCYQVEEILDHSTELRRCFSKSRGACDLQYSRLRES